MRMDGCGVDVGVWMLGGGVGMGEDGLLRMRAFG